MLRTDLLFSVSDDEKEVSVFVDEFIEDFIKSVIRAIYRETALIRKLLKDRRVNEEQQPPEENKDEAEQAFDEKGLIPIIFGRLQRRVPTKFFTYNTVLEFIRMVCI